MPASKPGTIGNAFLALAFCHTRARAYIRGMMGAPRRRSSASSQAEPGSSAWVADSVRQYTDLVYSAAARRVADPHLAEDIAQAVFLILARQPHKAARSASRSGSLVPWLLKTTGYAAANALKRQRRRIYHEQRAARAQGESAMTPHPSSLAAALAGGAIASSDPSEVLAWREIAPLLDDAILGLSGGDRTAIVMRYYEGRSTAEIASALGIRQDAVRQRLSRAVDKLRRKLESKGASLSAAVLAGLLGAHVVKAAPAHLAGACLSAITGGAAASATAAAIAKGAMAMSYSLKATAGTMVVAGGMIAGVMALAGGEGEAVAKASAAAPPAAPQPAPQQPTTKPMTAAEIDAAVLPVSDEVIQRTLTARAGQFRGPDDLSYLDLDTGHAYSVNEFGAKDAGQALDATLTNLSGQSPGLRGLGLAVQPVVASAWDEKHSPERMRALWTLTPAYGSGSYMDAIGKLPRTFMFRTDQGSAGVLQITELLHDAQGEPIGLRLRYRILARGEGRTVQERTAPAPPLPEAHQKRMWVVHQVLDLVVLHKQQSGDWPADLEALKQFAGDKWPADVPPTLVYARPRPIDPKNVQGEQPLVFESTRLTKPGASGGDEVVFYGSESGGIGTIRDPEKLAEMLKRASIEPPATQPSQDGAPK